MEHRLVEQARELLRSGGAQPEKRTLVHSDTVEGERSGMVCEGSQSNVFCVLAGDRDRTTVDAIASAVREDRPAWMTIDANGLRLLDRKPDFSRPPFALSGEGGGLALRGGPAQPAPAGGDRRRPLRGGAGRDDGAARLPDADLRHPHGSGHPRPRRGGRHRIPCCGLRGGGSR